MVWWSQGLWSPEQEFPNLACCWDSSGSRLCAERPVCVSTHRRVGSSSALKLCPSPRARPRTDLCSSPVACSNSKPPLLHLALLSLLPSQNDPKIWCQVQPCSWILNSRCGFWQRLHPAAQVVGRARKELGTHSTETPLGVSGPCPAIAHWEHLPFHWGNLD